MGGLHRFRGALMRTPPARYRSLFWNVYGSHPLHLLTMAAGFALLGYVLVTAKPVTLWNPQVWWQSIAVWFAAAIFVHDLVLFPIYSLVDRLLTVPTQRPRRRAPRTASLNYFRIAALGAGLTLLVFLPGIIEQGASMYQAATGQTRQPFLGRWLLLTAAMFAASALAYTIRLALICWRTSAGGRRTEARADPVRDPPELR
jgi:hypothetical protein